MNRRHFVALAATLSVAGCIDDDTTGSNRTDVNPAELPGLDREGLEDVDAFLDAHEATLDDTSHTLKLSVTAEDTFEDGFKASEARGYCDPAANRIRYRNWWRYPGGERSGETEIYVERGAAGRRTEETDGSDRLESLSTSAAREQYAAFRTDTRNVLSMFEYGSIDDTDDGYALPVVGVSDVAEESDILEVGSGTLRIAESGVVQSLTLTDVLERIDEDRYYDVTFEVMAVGETSVDEPEWFSDVSEGTSDDDSSADGRGGPGDESDGDGSSGTDDSGDVTEVLVGPDGDSIFDPATLTVAPGTTVRWTWESDTHNVVPTSQQQGSDWQGHGNVEDAGFVYEHVFETSGTYEYVCQPHAAVGMEGEIVVE